MDIYIGNVLDFVITSGIYIIIIGNLINAFKKSKGKNSNNSKSVNKTYKNSDNIYNQQPQKQVKKQSVFSSMMAQVDKFGDSFENIEKNWSKGQKSKENKSKIGYENPPIVKSKKTESKNQKSESQSVIITDEVENVIYQTIPEIKDIKSDVYDLSNKKLNVRASELRQAIIMKEVLDKPLAYRQTRR